MRRAWFLVGLLLASPAAAISPTEQLDRARVAYAALDFAGAELELIAVRAGLSQLDEARRRDALQLSAEVAMASERWADTDAHLDALLAANPRFEPAEAAWPPAWLAALARVRQARPDVLPPEVAANQPSMAVQGQPLQLSVTARDSAGVASVVLTIDGVDLPLAAAEPPVWSTRVDGAHVQPPELSGKIVATDARGNASDPLPISVPVVAAEAPALPVTSRWWFWTVLGAVAAGGAAAGIAVAVGGGEDGGTVRGQVEWP